MQEVAEVEVDEGGTFKYMLLRLQCADFPANPARSRLLLRGRRGAGYHRELLAACAELDARDGSQARPFLRW
jgi:hypothetical protein